MDVLRDEGFLPVVDPLVVARLKLLELAVGTDSDAVYRCGCHWGAHCFT